MAAIGIGTAQFGLNYGVSNTSGKTSLLEAKNILAYAASNSVSVLDTAVAYGDSESVLGLSAVDNSFKIITKTQALSTAKVTTLEAKLVKEVFHQSLSKLSRSRIYGLLVHDSSDLLKPGGERIFEALLELKEQMLVEKIGVSVYNAAQIDEILRRYRVDLFQVPLNIFDQRLLKSGHLKAMKDEGIEVHVRSVFLQGLLLMAPRELPLYFSKWKKFFAEFCEDLSQQNISQLEAAIQFVNRQPDVDVALYGISSLSQLAQIIKSKAHTEANSMNNFGKFSLDDEGILNPSLWNLV